MKGSFIRNTAAACALAFAAVGAQADIVTTWDYTITLKWVDWHFTSGGGSQTHSDTLISWGQSNGSHAVPGGTRSALEITDPPPHWCRHYRRNRGYTDFQPVRFHHAL